MGGLGGFGDVLEARGAWDPILLIEGLTWKLILGGQELLSAPCSLLSALYSLLLGSLGRLGAHSPKENPYLGIVLEARSCSLLYDLCSPLSALRSLLTALC